MRAIADRIAIFRNGTTVEIADSEAFLEDGTEELSHPYSRELWRRLPRNEFIDLPEPGKPDERMSSTGHDDALVVKNLSFSYKNRPAVVDGFSLRLEPGEIVGVLGSSGRGKTTIVRLIAGYLRPQSGTIAVGSSSASDFKDVPNPIQLLHQHPEKSLDPRWTMRKILDEAPAPFEGLLAELGIREQWLSRHPHELSGGELQRFCLARVINPHTRFLIADEMTAMLDAVTQATIWKVLLNVVTKHRMGLIVISHEQAIIEKVCHRTIDLL